MDENIENGSKEFTVKLLAGASLIVGVVVGLAVLRYTQSVIFFLLANLITWVCYPLIALFLLDCAKDLREWAYKGTPPELSRQDKVALMNATVFWPLLLIRIVWYLSLGIVNRIYTL